MRFIGIALLTLGIAACTSGSTLTPTPPPPASPEIAATATSVPPPTANPEPAVAATPDWDLEKVQRDKLADQLLIEADSVAANAIRFEGRDSRDLGELVRQFVPLFMASACVEGKETSVKDFRVFANNAIGNRTSVNRAAIRTIRVIIGAAESWRNESLDAATQHCLQPYLYPESVSDARPAIDLYLAARLPTLSPLAKGGFEALVRETAGGWFDQTDQQEPYISWLCGDNC